MNVVRDSPVRMVRERLDWFCGFPDVPELGFAVVAARSEVVLLVRVEVHVPHQLPVRVLYVIHLSAKTATLEQNSAEINWPPF